jgi:membrane protein
VRRTARRFVRFLAEVGRAQYRDQLLLRAGALAYTALLSVVPLLTVALVTVGRVQPEQAAVVVRAIATVLPFSPARVQATLAAFAQRTAALGWIAVVLSVLVTFNAFYQFEEVINAIWGLPRRRRWRWRLVSFATMLLCGPLLLTALFSTLYWLSSHAWYRLIAPIARPLPAVFAAVVLAALYRWVPHTKVSWRAAFTGAAVAAVALTALHLGFQSYLIFAADLNVIYGSLALLLFFLVSLFLFWYAVLLGAEASWVVGHATRPAEKAKVDAVIEMLTAAHRDGGIGVETIEESLGADAEELLTALLAPPAILVPSRGGFRVARAADAITLAEIKAKIEGEPREGSEAADPVTLAALTKHGEQRPPSDEIPATVREPTQR